MAKKWMVRPVREDDFAAFLDLAASTGGELTNIPGDPEVVRWRIDESVLSFDPRVHKAGSHRYLFLLEEADSRRVAGTCGIISKVGGFHPWYCYQRRHENVTYPPLGIDHQVEVLSPISNYNGPSEICSLFMRPESRRGGWGRLLSLSRFHFMAEFARRFDQQVIAELRGVTDAARTSPFWESVGRHFFQMDFGKADGLSGVEDKEFIEKLMPKHPLYAALLPEAARAVIGRAHPDAEAALQILLREGFVHRGRIDIFDAGPVVEADLGDIRTIRDRRKLPVVRVDETEPGGETYLLSNNRLDFRACVGSTKWLPEEEGVALDRATAETLELGEGDFVSISSLRDSGGPIGASGQEKKDRLPRDEGAKR